MTVSAPATPPGPNRHPLVSIVIPVYRGHPFLTQAIETALAQSWPEIEVIVVDDGSDDDGMTRSIIQRYGNRIRHIEKKNGGVATALNAGIAAMKGEYFSWLSHDDLYHPRKIETQMRVMQALDEPTILFGDYDLVDGNGSHLARIEFDKLHDPERSIWAVLEGRLNGCTMLIPRVCFDRCGTFPPGLPTTQDYELWFRMAREFRFVHVPGPLVRHRDHPGQGSKIHRHTEEASLLWLTMLDRLDRDAMSAAAGSELKFLIRTLRFLRQTGYQSARLNIEQRLLGLFREQSVTLIWGGSSRPYGSTLAEAVAQIELAGPKVAAVRIVETQGCAAPLGADTRLPDKLDCRICRVAPETVAEAVLDLAREAIGEAVVIADALRPLTSAELRNHLEQIAMDESDIVLRPAGAAAPQPANAAFCLPGALSGAVASTAALRGLEPGKAGAGGVLGQMLRDRRTDMATQRPVLPVPAEPAAGPSAAPPVPGALSRIPDPNRPTLMVVSRGRGGGTARFADHLGQLVAPKCNVLYATGQDDRTIRLSSASPDLPEVVFDLPEQLDACLAVLQEWRVGRVDVVHTEGLQAHLPELLTRLAVPYDLTMVDFHLIASAPHLMTDEVAPASRAPSLKALVAGADRRIAISRHTAGLCTELAPEHDFTAARIVEPHNPRGFDLRTAPLAADEPLRVALLAPLVPHKGSDLVLEVARRCRLAGRPIEFHVTGWPGNPPPPVADQQNLRLHDLRNPDDLNRFVCLFRPHLAWLPLIAPETHSFVTSDAMLQGLPILASAVGALPERLEGRDATWLVEPPDQAEAHEAWLLRLLEDRLTTPSHWVATDDLPPLLPDFYPGEYLRPLFCQADEVEPERARASA